MTRPRGTTNRNDRGSSYQRRARKLWLLTEFGDGVSAACSLAAHPRCLGRVTMDTITVDRYPVPGIEGGTYRRGNIRPACPVCNYSDGGRLGNTRRRGQREQQREQEIPEHDPPGLRVPVRVHGRNQFQCHRNHPRKAQVFPVHHRDPSERQVITVVKKKVGGTPARAATKAKAKENSKIAGAVAGRQHAADDIERGQTPMGAEAAEALLNVGKEHR